MTPQRKMPLVVQLLLLGCAFILFLFGHDFINANSASRLAAVEAIVDYGTFAIGNSVFSRTPDIIRWEENYYSSKPPLLSVIASVPYWAYKKITGLKFANAPRRATRFMHWIMGAVPHLVMLYVFYLFLSEWVASRRAVTFGFLSAAIGSLGLGYATTFNNLTTAGLMVLASFFIAFRIRNKGLTGWGAAAASGMLAGLAASFDVAAIFFVVSFGLYLAPVRRPYARPAYVLGALIPLSINWMLTYIISGSIVPYQARWEELYLYPGSYWLTATGLDGLTEPKPLYIFHMLIGHHGLIAMTPLYGLGFWSIGRSVLKRDERSAEAMAIGIPSLALILFYLFFTRNYGGECVGFRWFLTAAPVVFLFVGSWIESSRWRWPHKLLFVVVLAVSAVNAWDAVRSPWKQSAWHTLWVGNEVHSGKIK